MEIWQYASIKNKYSHSNKQIRYLSFYQYINNNQTFDISFFGCLLNGNTMLKKKKKFFWIRRYHFTLPWRWFNPHYCKNISIFYIFIFWIALSRAYFISSKMMCALLKTILKFSTYHRMDIYIHIYIYIYIYMVGIGVYGVMVIVIGKGFDDLSLIPQWSCSNTINTFEKDKLNYTHF